MQTQPDLVAAILVIDIELVFPRVQQIEAAADIGQPDPALSILVHGVFGFAVFNFKNDCRQKS